ncbi:MAG: 30S ribosomal protein S4 [Candidatus Liptonbacteria bacterium]|nr:30S ribosomal protein S4 [Candidatus Liptonbacteria bacterium]
MFSRTKEKKERALGERLQLKGHRCNSPKCAFVRKPHRPGMHGRKRQRGTVSDFGRQIREKQKFKLTYGVDERNLRRLFGLARKKVGSTAQKLVELLERRLDNVVFRLGFAPSRAAAHQLITHGHVLVNGKRVKSPAFSVAVGDVVAIRESSRAIAPVKDAVESLKTYSPPSWLALDAAPLTGRVVRLPDETAVTFDTNLLVESFSK